jgi:phosphate transport system protein
MPTTRHQFEAALNELRNALIRMGQAVEKSLVLAIQSLKDGDQSLADDVIKSDPLINKMEEEIDNIGTNLIATQQPVAKDLRRILIAFKMAADLERMGDLAVDIAKVTKRIGGEPLIKPLVDIPRMADIVRVMTSDSITSYVEENLDLAYKMAKMDDEVDHLHSQILRETFVFMVENPKTVNQVLQLCFVSRYLERMADHATNIGESVVYLLKGVRPDLNN